MGKITASTKDKIQSLYGNWTPLLNSLQLQMSWSHPSVSSNTQVAINMYLYTLYSGAKKVFSQPPIVQILPLKTMREACNFHHRYNSTMTDKIRKKSRKSHCRIFNEFICKLWWKISIWSPTNKQDFWLPQTCNFFFKRLLCPPLVTCINGTCLNLLLV